MKKVLPLLLGSSLAFMIFAMPGNSVKAAEPTNATQSTAAATDGGCSCHDVTQVEGKEKVIIIANLLGSKEFWNASLQALKDGYYVKDVSKIEVVKHNQTGQVLIGVPFQNRNGNVVMFAFSNGKFLGTSPM